MTLSQRIKRIQRHLDITADGIIGPVTLSAIESAMELHAPRGDIVPEGHHLAISRRAFDLIVKSEIGSRSYYSRYLDKPTWPGGYSGVTIGIGYDLGYNSAAAIDRDWSPHLSHFNVVLLADLAGIKGAAARRALAGRVSTMLMEIPYSAALSVFCDVSLPKFARLTRKTWPGVELLPPDVQGVLLSLIYNRGNSLRGDRRREMADIKRHVKSQDLPAIAESIRSMKRLWRGKGLDGLLRRREREAKLVLSAAEHHDESERVYL